MDAEILAIYDAYMILDGQRVDILGDGKATVTVPRPSRKARTSAASASSLWTTGATRTKWP